MNGFRALLCLAFPVVAHGQSNVAFRALELPAPSLTRDASGRPGAHYWQQRVDYAIDATLDTASQTIRGREIVRYVNHSPDTLRALWFQLDQNLYRADSRGAQRFPGVGRAKPDGFPGGYTEISATTGGAVGEVALSTEVKGTMMRVDLARPLAAGDSVAVQLAWRFGIPENGSERMGRAHLASGPLYAVAQWYPRVAVYDDINGWNLDEYLGQGEFYLEYGNFDFAVTLPRTFVVTGTGELANAAEVLTPTERNRLAAARTSDQAVAIIGGNEAGRRETRPPGESPTLTWRFHATNVRDVAWAASPSFRWDACGWHGILLQTLYAPEAHADWSRAIGTVQRTIRDYSTTWFPYPYLSATAVAAPLKSGMEYPMFVFDPMDQGGPSLESVVLHEIGHQWFPMIVGSNERRHAWMDEGFDSFINWVGLGRKPTGNGRGAVRWLSGGRPGPIVQAADSIAPKDYDPIEYGAPDDGLELLRYEILDDSTQFDAAFREYIRRWAFKHPTPADFFRTMDDVLQTDLSWLWRGWFYRTDIVELAVDSVRVRMDTTNHGVTWIFLSNRGTMPMIVPLTLRFADGGTVFVKLPVDIWRNGNQYAYKLNDSRALTAVEIDAKQNIPVVRRDNNRWVKTP